MKSETTGAEIISDLSAVQPIKDIGIEEAGIDDIISIAYQQKSSL